MTSPWAGARPFVVGHRGGRGEGWPDENTLEAFERAAREGARAVELDVRLAGDGEVVVVHDEDLGRATGGARTERVEALSTPELARIPLVGGGRIASLREVLAWARRRGVAVNVELKHEVTSQRRLAAVATAVIREAAGVDVLVSSFHPGLLAWTAVFAPEVRRALLTQPESRRRTLLWSLSGRRPLCAAVHLRHDQATPARLHRAKRRGLVVGVWTVNDPNLAASLVAAGAAYVITDAPGAIAARLA